MAEFGLMHESMISRFAVGGFFWAMPAFLYVPRS
jgi:hypothetical protein